jgi:hypothetical protein
VRAWIGVYLLALATAPSPARAEVADPVGLEAAIAEVRAALADMADALNGAPRQITVSTDLHLTGEAIARTLNRLDGAGGPIPDPSLVYDLDFLADVAHAATDELHAIAAGSGVAPDPERGQRIDRLTEAAAARLAEINLVADSWNQRNRDALIEVRDDDGVLVIRSTDRRVYNGIRYVSIALLLVGLLAFGLHLLRAGQQAPERWPPVAGSPLVRELGTVVLVAFFASCAVLSVRPGMLARCPPRSKARARSIPASVWRHSAIG